MNWMISANANVYDLNGAYQKLGIIDWRQNKRKYSEGDKVYIYCTSPLQKVMYESIVIDYNIKEEDKIDDREFWNGLSTYTGTYVRLKIVKEIDSDGLNLDNLKKHGLKAAPQGPMKLKGELDAYITNFFSTEENNHFPELIADENCIEGAIQTIQVNKYERSKEARDKCISVHGCSCKVCDINFETKYGELGKGFIHVHHIIPLGEIREEYVVNPVNDLVPVCPNCHAMLHRKINGKNLPIDELKLLLELV